MQREASEELLLERPTYTQQMADCPSSFKAARDIYKSKRDGYRTMTSIKQRAESNTNGYNMTSD